ncbi:hypothetical protein SOVF_109530 [Spinacia oleracea]|nr:hypothetical protein SOVF_109530 [Spinacia oleracea]
MATLRSIGGKCRALLAESTTATGATKRSEPPFSAASGNNNRGILVSPTPSDLELHQASPSSGKRCTSFSEIRYQLAKFVKNTQKNPPQE